jgi:hypothetical protein
LVVNCFERTYRQVLTEGFFPSIEADNLVRFASRTVVINNVDDRAEAARLADARVASGEIDRWAFVADHIEEAMGQLQVDPASLGVAPWFTDWVFVAVCLPGPEYVLLWDADVRLSTPHDWLSPATALLSRDPRVLVANPMAANETHLLKQWSFDRSGEFTLSYGCSDQVMLGRRRELAAPIYGERTLSRLRFPLAHVTYIFEARIDSYMRRHDRARATYPRVTYEHRQEDRVSYPRVSPGERVQLFLDQALIWTLKKVPWVPRHLRHL